MLFRFKSRMVYFKNTKNKTQQNKSDKNANNNETKRVQLLRDTGRKRTTAQIFKDAKILTYARNKQEEIF